MPIVAGIFFRKTTRKDFQENISYKDWEIVAKIRGEKFKSIRPVNTLVQAKLVGDCLVEIEAKAFLPN